MRKLNGRVKGLIIVAMCFFGGRSFSQGIYDLSIVIQTNESVQLKKFKGKKVLVAVFPESKQANEFMADIDLFIKEYGNEAAVIGVSSAEAGYQFTDGPKPKDFLLATSCLYLTNLVNISKKSGKQLNLFSWLTMKDMNKHFNVDAVPGQKYFIDENGELYAVLGAGIRLGHPIIKKVMSIRMKSN